MQTEAEFILRKYWGHDNFRPLQKDIIQSIIAGNDVLALLPTGGGKSVCFQVPAMMMDGLCLVISPLIALMKDQVENLKNKGIPALAVYSGMHFSDVKKTLQNAAFGNYKFLYISPERLETDLFLEFLPAIKPCLIAIDEAHCISQWGYDFRPPYLRISNLRLEVPGVPVIALTASATLPVQNDICEKLNFRPGYELFQQSFERKNLSYSIFEPPSKQTKLLEILKNVPGSSIVYCKSRKQAQHVADLLKLNKVEADYYHAGLNSEQRTLKQESWVKNKCRVIVATNAFGMGIDKADVRSVIHYDIPDSIENYYQEAGRAGRDGKRAYAVMLKNANEMKELYSQIEIRFPGKEEIKEVYIALMNYLQVPAGIGEGQTFNFDIALFTEKFKLNILKATYCLQALAQQDLISYAEVFYKPSTLCFTVTKTDLAEFENRQPDLEPVIKGLLRNYEGIFDYPTTIYESLLAKFLGKPIEEIKNELKKLHNYQIVHYQPQNDKPQLMLLQNRMYADNFTINIQDHLLRKQNYSVRMDAVSRFVSETKICRAVLIGNYFNDKKIKACGICDNCINNKPEAINDAEFKNISETMIMLLKARTLSVSEMESNFKNHKKQNLWQVINFLREENMVVSDEKGNLSLPE